MFRISEGWTCLGSADKMIKDVTLVCHLFVDKFNLYEISFVGNNINELLRVMRGEIGETGSNQSIYLWLRIFF